MATTEIEKIREVPISTVTVSGTETACLKLLIPNTVVDKLGLKGTRDTGLKTTLYVSPPIDQIKRGEAFDLIYKVPAIPQEEEKTNPEEDEEIADLL